MDASSSVEITTLLAAHREGDRAAYDRLVSLLYDELRRLARRERRRLRPGDTLNTTSLVHEAYAKLSGGAAAWEDTAHFLAASAKAMRHILVDAARARLSAKRGSGNVVALPPDVAGERRQAEEVIAVNDAIAKLTQLDERLGSVVECRFFAGMTEEETARVLGVTSRTVRRDWFRARGWLRRELGRTEFGLEPTGSRPL
jgi:RNA polymerase sigma factor (TIGR02999 family)